MHFVIFHSEICKKRLLRLWHIKLSGPYLNPPALERFSCLASRSQDGRSILPSSQGVKTIHQVRANSQKEWVSAQKHASTKKAYHLFPAGKKKKQQRNYSECQKRPLELWCSERTANMPTSPFFLTCCKICFPFYNWKTTMSVQMYFLDCNCSSAPWPAAKHWGPDSAALTHENNCCSNQANLLKSISCLLLPATCRNVEFMLQIDI